MCHVKEPGETQMVLLGHGNLLTPILSFIEPGTWGGGLADLHLDESCGLQSKETPEWIQSKGNSGVDPVQRKLVFVQVVSSSASSLPIPHAIGPRKGAYGAHHHSNGHARDIRVGARIE